MVNDVIPFNRFTGENLLIECMTTEPKALVTLQVSLEDSDEIVDGQKLFGKRLVDQVNMIYCTVYDPKK